MRAHESLRTLQNADSHLDERKMCYMEHIQSWV